MEFTKIDKHREHGWNLKWNHPLKENIWIFYSTTTENRIYKRLSENIDKKYLFDYYLQSFPTNLKAGWNSTMSGNKLIQLNHNTPTRVKHVDKEKYLKKAAPKTKIVGENEYDKNIIMLHQKTKIKKI